MRDARRRFHKQGGSGIRINLRKEQEWDPDNALFKAAGDLGMIVSVIGDAANFASARFRKLLDNCPDTHFCLEHLLRSPGSDVAQPPYTGYARSAGMRAMAQHHRQGSGTRAKS